VCSYLKIVHENVLSLRPKVPQTSARGGTMIPKLNTQTKRIMRKMLV
jgi:hypothetical protein